MIRYASLMLLFVVSFSKLACAADLPPRMQAGKYELQLNGSGARTKALVPLYEAGLYLRSANDNAAEIIASQQPMALRIKITSSFVSQEKLVASLTDGFEAATQSKTQAIATEISQFREFFRDRVAKGDTFDLVYAPEYGVIVNKNGKLMGVVRGEEFKRALFGIWLSDTPADKSLKQALLSNGVSR